MRGGACEHDEDRDGIGDCTDLCPHLSDPAQLDTDVDGVGDACDPGTAAQHLVYFSPMTAGTPAIQSGGTGTWTQLADAMHHDGQGEGFLTLPVAVRDVDIWIGVRIAAMSPLGIEHIGILPMPVSGLIYYAEFYQQPPPGVAGVTSFDGVATHTEITNVPVSSFPIGVTALRLGVRSGAGQMVAILSQPMTTAFGSVPGYAGAPSVRFNLEYLDVDVEYIAVIETP